MIYIWDNGYEYSDHEVEFIESDLPREDVETIMAPFKRSGDRFARIDGVAERIDWREAGNNGLAYWIGRHLDQGHDDCPAEFGGAVDLHRCTCARRPAVDAAIKHGLVWTPAAEVTS